MKDDDVIVFALLALVLYQSAQQAQAQPASATPAIAAPPNVVTVSLPYVPYEPPPWYADICDSNSAAYDPYICDNENYLTGQEWNG